LDLDKKTIPTNVDEFFNDESFEDYAPKTKFDIFIDGAINEQYQFINVDVAIEELTRSIDRDIINSIISLADERK